MPKIRCYRMEGRVIYYASSDNQYHWVIEDEWPKFIALHVPHAPTTLRGTFAQCQGMIEQYDKENNYDPSRIRRSI